jgi:FlaA1/EpsC-like NDP-sugar epimerase
LPYRTRLKFSEKKKEPFMTATDPREYPDKRVLVTGGTKGAGKAIAERFLQTPKNIPLTAEAIHVTSRGSRRWACNR